MKPSQPQATVPMIDVNGPSHIDALGRARFARELLEVVRILPAEGGAVVGLEGEWGSGKTWVLEHLDCLNEEQGEDEQVLLIRFNPWMVSGSAEIVETLLIQLASELGTTNRRSSLQNGAAIAGKLIEYTGVLSSVKHLAPMANLLLPGSGLVLEGVAHVAGAAASAAKEMAGSTLDRLKKEPGKLSLNAAREAVKTLLKKAERKIAVLVDDLDRLPPAELAAMVQAVKAVADFPNVVYVLAYDPEAAAHALEEALRLRPGEGRRYLEKIVQFAMPVPEVPAFKMQEFAERRLQKSLGPVGAEDKPDLVEALRRAAALMRSPRDVLRMSTRLLLLVRRLVAEISPADLLLVEALNLKVPHVIEYVQQHQGAMLRAYVEGGPVRPPRSKWELHRDALVEPITDLRLKEAVRSAVAYLFDEVPEDLGFNETHNASRRRIQKVRNWSRWRTVVRHHEVFENSEVSAWLQRPREVKSSRAWADFESFLEFCRGAADLAGETADVDAVGFVELFGEAAQRFGEQPLEYEPQITRFGPQHALIAVIRSDRAGAPQAVARLIGACSVWLSQHIVWTVCSQTLGARDRDASPTDNPLVGNKDVAAGLVERWRDKAIAWLGEVSEPTPGRPACHLATWAFLMGHDADPLRGELARIVEQRPRGLEICFCDPMYSDQRIEHFGLLHQEVLPEPDILKAALSCSPGFEDGHERLLNWKTMAASKGNSLAIEVMRTVTTPDAPTPAAASAPAPASPSASPPPPPHPPPPAPPAPPPTDR